MTINFPAITVETVLTDVATLVEAKAIARDMRRTAIVVADAHGEASDIARSVSARYSMAPIVGADQAIAA